MTSEERNAWIYGIVTVIAYATYVILIVAHAGGDPLAKVDYVGTMIWTIVAAIVANITLNIVLSIVTPRSADKKDRRDREIGRYGEYTGRALVIAGAVAALILAMVEAEYFWIANVIYLGFVLSAVVGSTVKIVAYRRGLPTW